MLINDIGKVSSIDLLLTISFLIFWNLQIVAFVAGPFSVIAHTDTGVHTFTESFSTGSELSVSVILSSYMHSRAPRVRNCMHRHSAGVHV